LKEQLRSAQTEQNHAWICSIFSHWDQETRSQGTVGSEPKKCEF
jgi:hypothetical protein